MPRLAARPKTTLTRSDGVSVLLQVGREGDVKPVTSLDN
jgi:hypothetical protein